MADRLTDTTFEPAPRPAGRPSPYPLAEWMDGSVWIAWCGEDYDGPPKHMQARLHHYAVTRGMRVRTRTVYDGQREGMKFQFMPRERDPWDDAPTSSVRR